MRFYFRSCIHWLARNLAKYVLTQQQHIKNDIIDSICWFVDSFKILDKFWDKFVFINSLEQIVDQVVKIPKPLPILTII